MITKESSFEEALSKKPEAAEIMFKYGLHCIGCMFSPLESVEEGAKAHGLSDKEIEEMLKEINKG